MHPSTAKDRSSILWGVPEDPRQSITRLHSEEARFSNSRYLHEESSDSARHSNRHHIGEESPVPTRYSNLRYVEFGTRFSDYAGFHHDDANSEVSEHSQASVGDYDVQESVNSNQIIIPETEDRDNLVISHAGIGLDKHEVHHQADEEGFDENKDLFPDERPPTPTPPISF